jgi:hypothetical protein
VTAAGCYLRELATATRYSLLYIAVTAGLFLGLATIETAFPGDSYHLSAKEVGTASVDSCSRTPLVSAYGVGQWWKCRVIVSYSDGRKASALVRPGVFSPADIGRSLSVVEHCRSGSDGRQCSYSRPSPFWLALIVRFAGIVKWLTLFVGGVMAFVTLSYGILGGPIFRKIFPFFRGPSVNGEKNTERGAVEMEGQQVAELSGQGLGNLHVTFQYPNPMKPLYEQSSPTLSVDGQPVQISGWGTAVTPLSPGRHRVEVAVTLGVFRQIGAASMQIDMAGGDHRVLIYEAPTLPGNAGRIYES